MTQSLPGQAPAVGPSADDPAPGGQNRVRDAIVNAASGATLRALPRIPNAVKRLLLGGRSVTVDGNTLDTTLQLMLAGQRATGIDGLVPSDDVARCAGPSAHPGRQRQTGHSGGRGDQSLDTRPGGPDPGPALSAGTTPTALCWSSSTAAGGSSAISRPTTICAD